MKIFVLFCGLFATVFANHGSGYQGAAHASHGASAHHGDHHAAAHAGHGASAHHHESHKTAYAGHSNHGHSGHVAQSHTSSHGARSGHAAARKPAAKSVHSTIHHYVVSKDRQVSAAKASSKARVSGAVMYKHLLPAPEKKKTKPAEKKPAATQKGKSHKTKSHNPKHARSARHYEEAPPMYQQVGPMWYPGPRFNQQPHYKYKPQPQKYFPAPPKYGRPQFHKIPRQDYQIYDIEEPKYQPQAYEPDFGLSFYRHQEYEQPMYKPVPKPYGPRIQEHGYQPSYNPHYRPRHHFNKYEPRKTENHHSYNPFIHTHKKYEPQPKYAPKYEPKQYFPRPRSY